MDLNWSELLQELRVTQTGVQLLSGFLLASLWTNPVWPTARVGSATRCIRMLNRSRAPQPSEDRLAAGDPQHGSGHVAGVGRRRQEHVGGCYLARLTGPTQRGVSTECLQLVTGLSGRL